jgi:hypothetical protein
VPASAGIDRLLARISSKTQTPDRSKTIGR